MIYLIVGLDRTTLRPWHRHVMAADVATAKRLGRARAATQGVQLVIAAAIGPNSSIVPDPVEAAPARSHAA